MTTDTRSFLVTNTSYEAAQGAALQYFNVGDKTLLNTEVLEKGKRKFILFGARTTKYKFTVKPIFKKILLPYVIKLIKLSGLSLYAKVFYKEPEVRIVFSGQDMGLLLRNRAELLRSYETVIKLYLMKKVNLKPGTKIYVDAERDSDTRKPRNTRDNRDDRGDTRRREPSRGPRPYNTRAQVDEKQLMELAEELKQQVINNGAAVQTRDLSPAERRIIHQHLDADKSVKTTSIGEDRFKKIEISLI